MVIYLGVAYLSRKQNSHEHRASPIPRPSHDGCIQGGKRAQVALETGTGNMNFPWSKRHSGIGKGQAPRDVAGCCSMIRLRDVMRKVSEPSRS